MAYKRVVVLGGGPIGLLCAIEAKQQGFREVYLIEKRPEYTRPNVPQLYKKVLKHIDRLVPGEIQFERKNMGNLPFEQNRVAATSKSHKFGRYCEAQFLCG